MRIDWVIWGCVLIVQQLTHVLSSRAKNSNSYAYNAFAATLSHASWISSNFFMVSNIIDATKSGNRLQIVGTALFYVVLCVVGALLGQYLAIKWIEKLNWKEVTNRHRPSCAVKERAA